MKHIVFTCKGYPTASEAYQQMISLTQDTKSEDDVESGILPYLQHSLYSACQKGNFRRRIFHLSQVYYKVFQ